LLSASEIKEKFIKFFESKGHTHLPSSSLVPHNDPSVLLTTAGMLQFKPIMFGLEAPTYKTVTTYQKCCRTTDLDNVGKTPRHHTFFEMLGNFSFGDYYKREAIAWAWEFISTELKFPIEKLNITVHHKDTEAYEIWNKEMGIPEDRIVKLDDKDNFWAAGETGPCGFCSEIYYDRGEQYGDGSPDEKAGSESDRYLEFWNLVFMEFNRKEDGTLDQLPSKNIDTGMGLERVASIIQNVQTNYDIDSFKTIINKISEISGKTYNTNPKEDLFFKIIADHIRATTYLVADGVRPGNTTREYVLRRIIRRAVRYGRMLEITRPFLHEIIPTVIEMGKKYYPELSEKFDNIVKIVSREEELFNRTLNNGLKILNKLIETTKNSNSEVISGKDAFELYDTYGFPLELTLEIALENNLTVDENEYNQEMKKQVERAREAHNSTNLNDIAVQMDLDNIPSTQFTGYEEYKSESEVLSVIFSKEKKEIAFIVDKTPAYAESGGQASDKGEVIIDEQSFKIKNIQKVGDYFVHIIDSEEDILSKGDKIKISVEDSTRINTARHHSVTHLLHQALKVVLGDHVKQAGSLVNENQTRFDFAHNSALSKDEVLKIEELVNQKILENMPVSTEVMDIDSAKKSGAVAMFGEKYGAKVRVLTMGDFSKEFCGGTHVNRTGDIGFFRIIGEEAISAGVRRITGVAGSLAYKYMKDEEKIVSDLSAKFKVPAKDVISRVDKLQSSLNDLEREFAQLKQMMAVNQVKELVSKTKEVFGIKYIAEKVDIQDMKDLKSASEDLLNRLGESVVVLASVIEQKACFIAVVSKSLTQKGVSAGNIIKAVGLITGSKGGGKPESAQAGGGTDIDKIELALEEVQKVLSSIAV